MPSRGGWNLCCCLARIFSRCYLLQISSLFLQQCENARQIWRCLRSSHCVSAIMVHFELCVWGTQDGGPHPITYTPHHLCHISLWMILQHLSIPVSLFVHNSLFGHTCLLILSDGYTEQHNNLKSMCKIILSCKQTMCNFYRFQEQINLCWVICAVNQYHWSGSDVVLVWCSHRHKAAGPTVQKNVIFLIQLVGSFPQLYDKKNQKWWMLVSKINMNALNLQ